MHLTISTDRTQLNLLLGQLIETRKRLLELLQKLPENILDFTPHERKVETIGTLLLHIADVEWSWIFEDIDGQEMDFETAKYAFPLRPEVNIPQLTGKDLSYYTNILQNVRQEVFEYMNRFTDADLQKKIGENYSIEWILYHINHHEAQHYGQIQLLRRLAAMAEAHQV